MRLVSITVLVFTVIFVTNTCADIAVIVNKSNPVSDISYNELKQILEARKQYWNNGEKITLIFKAITSSETRLLIDKIYKIKYEDFDKYWFLKAYDNKIMEFPKILGSAGTINILVSEIPGAIAFIGINDVSRRGNVKTLMIDGKLPDEDGYPLK
ncbi:MAG: substrate-binding domain-containing protein [Planctomycetes bacterium]|nr:substrate-binding domain-containing protein [Planctomycetota bacterium]